MNSNFNQNQQFPQQFSQQFPQQFHQQGFNQQRFNQQNQQRFNQQNQQGQQNQRPTVSNILAGQNVNRVSEHEFGSTFAPVPQYSLQQFANANERNPVPTDILNPNSVFPQTIQQAAEYSTGLNYPRLSIGIPSGYDTTPPLNPTYNGLSGAATLYSGTTYPSVSGHIAGYGYPQQPYNV